MFRPSSPIHSHNLRAIAQFVVADEAGTAETSFARCAIRSVHTTAMLCLTGVILRLAACKLVAADGIRHKTLCKAVTQIVVAGLIHAQLLGELTKFARLLQKLLVLAHEAVSQQEKLQDLL